MINVLSLFDGMSGAKIALDNLGIECVYYASEIDKYARQISLKNHKKDFNLGGVEEVCKTPNYFKDPIHLLIGGSPCQDLSISKKNRTGLKGDRSKLFYEYVRILKAVKPKYFLLENVASMKKGDSEIITGILGVEPIMINSALVTAQNRKRYYWTNIPNVGQPEDRNIHLKDILEESVDEKYYLSDKEIIYMNRKTRDGRNHWDFGHHHDSSEKKSHCISANMFKGVPYNVLIDKPNQVGHIKKNRQAERIYSVNGKSVTLKGEAGGQGAKTGLYIDPKEPHMFTECRTEEAKRLRREHREKTGKDWCPRRGKELQARQDGKANCLTTGITKEHILHDGTIVRKLTPLECERLQGVPDGYTEGVSNTQRYKMIGNGFTIPIISHILKNMEI